MTKIVFATSNENKIKEVKEMLSNTDIEIISLNDLSLKVRVEESGITFEENARIKAEDIANQCSYPVFSDDSGLCINSLYGFPGVHSARFMEGQSYAAKNEAILKRMENCLNRSASFYTSMVFIDKSRNIEKVFEGRNDGEISKYIDPRPISGFGYDPIFYSYDLKKLFSQATIEEKDSVSHRGRAMKQLIDFLSNEYMNNNQRGIDI